MNRAHRRTPRLLALLPALVLAAAVALTLVLTRPGPREVSAAQAGRAQPASAGQAASPDKDSPSGFYYGTDSWPIAINSPAPYRAPYISGNPVYGGYIGMAGNWARWQGCGGNIAWSSVDSAAANTNYTKYGKGIGTGVYWFMGGPGVDPHYNGTTTEASAWGAAQAAKTLRAIGGLHVTYKIVWLDIELPGIKPALDNGWNNVYTSPCSGTIKSAGVAASVDRAEVNGYEAYLTAHSSYVPGVYSSPVIWYDIFGTGSASSIPGTYEWTYTDGTSHINPAPSKWCIPGTSTCANFFGGVKRRSEQAVAWQWSGGGGITNGIGDFDQINENTVK